MTEQKKGRGRPAMDPAKKAKSYAVKLTPAAIDAIKAKAEAHRVSQARLIAMAVDAYPAAPTEAPQP